MAEARLSPLELPRLTQVRMDFALPFIEAAKPALLPLPYPLPEMFEEPPPATGGYDSYSRWTTSTRQRLHHVIEVENGFANRTGDVYDASGRRIELASHKSKANPNFLGVERNTLKSVQPLGVKPRIGYDGDVFVVTSSTSKLYYHGLLEIVPRLHIAQKMGMGSKFPVYVDASKPFMQECLKALKIDNIIDASQHPYIRAKRMIVPCYEIGRFDHIPYWTLELVRSLFHADVTVSRSADKRFYLSRIGNTRRALKNSSEVETYFLKKGFEILSPEKLSILEQANLFQQAQFVIGPSGGAFTNIVFCNPAAKAVNFFHWQADDTFFRLSKALSLNYAYVSSRPAGISQLNFKKGIKQDYRIEISDIDRTLELIM